MGVGIRDFGGALFSGAVVAHVWAATEMSGVWYNDSEPFVCDWLENLMREKLIPVGVVDRRPIQEVEPRDVQDFTQCHFFAGIGGWAYALQLAGWGDRPVWTGSCPCQPFSAAGKRGSHADERHLWPAWYDLIRECRPVTIFGEQVSGAAGLGWLDAVALDMEAADYAVGACVLGAHSVGAPHLRQRLYFVADTEHAKRGTERHQQRSAHGRDGPGRSSNAYRLGDAKHAGLLAVWQLEGTQDPRRLCEPEGSSPTRLVADASDTGRSRAGSDPQPEGAQQQPCDRGGKDGPPVGELADAECGGREPPFLGNTSDSQEGTSSRPATRPVGNSESKQARGTGQSWENFWGSGDWLPCRDGKARPVEPGTFPLAHGIPQRVGRLRAYGNAIVPQVAAAFVTAYLECVGFPEHDQPR